MLGDRLHSVRAWIYIYIYIYICVCRCAGVCVFSCVGAGAATFCVYVCECV